METILTEKTQFRKANDQIQDLLKSVVNTGDKEQCYILIAIGDKEISTHISGSGGAIINALCNAYDGDGNFKKVVEGSLMSHNLDDDPLLNALSDLFKNEKND